MSSALKLINIQLGLGVMLLILLLTLQEGDSRPMGHNEANYDASLDPLVWSRPFVQDKVRKHRIAILPNPYKHRHVHSQSQLCPELDRKRRRQQSMKRYRTQLKYNTKSNSNYRKYLHRRRKLLLLQTRC